MRKNLLALLFGIVISFFILEIFLHVYQPFGFRVAGDSIKLKKDYRIVLKQTKTDKLDAKIIHSKNSIGFRGPNPPLNFEDYLSIVVVGGSTTEGYYLSDGQDWPAVMSQYLKPTFRNLWVNNAGLDGHSTYGHWILLKRHLIELKPKYIVFLVGINDIGRDDFNNFDKSLLMIDEDKRSGATGAKFDLAKYSAVWATIQNLQRYEVARQKKLTHHIIDFANLPYLNLSQEYIQRATEGEAQYAVNYFGRLSRMIDFVRKMGMRPILVTQPSMYGGGIDPTTGVNLDHIKINDGVNGQLRADLLDKYNVATRAISRAKDVPLIDLAKLMPKDSQYFYDFIHFGKQGSVKVGQIMAQSLADILKDHSKK